MEEEEKEAKEEEDEGEEEEEEEQAEEDEEQEVYNSLIQLRSRAVSHHPPCPVVPCTSTPRQRSLPRTAPCWRVVHNTCWERYRSGRTCRVNAHTDAAHSVGRTRTEIVA